MYMYFLGNKGYVISHLPISFQNIKEEIINIVLKMEC